MLNLESLNQAFNKFPWFYRVLQSKFEAQGVYELCLDITDRHAEITTLYIYKIILFCFSDNTLAADARVSALYPVPVDQEGGRQHTCQEEQGKQEITGFFHFKDLKKNFGAFSKNSIISNASFINGFFHECILYY